LKYVPTKDYKPFTKALKSVYQAVSLKQAVIAFDSLKKQYADYHGAIDV
jgi:transposase-like protein